MTHCDNPRCDSLGIHQVPVSVAGPSDQTRMLCASCEEAYTWGVQHGRMIGEQAGGSAAADAGEAGEVRGALARFLREKGFIVLGRNRSDPSPGMEIEACAYEGPLDFASATPVTFGVGIGCLQALEALDIHLAHRHGDRVHTTRRGPA